MKPPVPASPLSAPSIPPEAGDEGTRLLALRRYEILDTPGEDAFDRITTLTARLFDVPIAFIALVAHERVWYKSRHGEYAPEMLRELSLCTRVVESGDVLWVEDASTDPEWRHLPQVVGPPGVRFYGAAPLRTPDGHLLGTLGVIDQRPRTLLPANVETLRDLAGVVMDELELRRVAGARWDAAASDFAARYAELFEANPHPMWIYDTETLAFLSVNRAAMDTYGYSRDEFLAMTIADIRPPEDVERLRASIPSEVKFTTRELWRHRKKDGALIDVEISSGPVAIADGRRARLVLAYDISARRQAEAALLLRDRYLAVIVEVQREMLRHAQVADGLARVLALLGEASDASRVYYFEVVPEPSGRQAIREDLYWCAPGVEPPGDFNAEHVRADQLKPEEVAQLGRGEAVELQRAEAEGLEAALLDLCGAKSILVAPMLVEGKLRGMLGFANTDATRRWQPAEIDHLRAGASALASAFEREDTARALAEEKERLTVTLASITEGVLTVDLHGKVVLLNRVAEELLGWSSADALGQPLSEVFRMFSADDPADCEPQPDCLERVFLTGRPVVQTRGVWLQSREGEERRRVAVSTAPVYGRDGQINGAVRVLRDVSAQEKMTEEMIKASKLESVGILAGGIAHDFNNILTAVMGNLSLARVACEGSLPDREGTLHKLDEAERACRRAKELTGQLLTFAKGGAPLKTLVRLPDLIRESVGFALHGSPVQCRFFVVADLWPVEVDVAQLGQVLSNLALNAVQAMSKGGWLEVRAENILLSDDADSELPDGRYVKLSVEDQGCGIAAENMARIFDPFFSTKEYGTGLGLATCYSIIKKHHGRITVDSVPDVGTVFRIWVPATLREPAATVAPAAAPQIPTGQGRILLMDDEAAILDLAATMLTYLGYEVTQTNHGAAAIAAYREALLAGDPYRAVILDLTVPGNLDGRDVAVELRRLDPNVRAIVSSGYSNDPVMGDFSSYGFRGVLSKPYRMDELAAVLAATVGGGAGSTTERSPSSLG